MYIYVYIHVFRKGQLGFSFPFIGDKIEGKKRERKDCGRFSGSEKPHLVLKNIQGCCCCSSPRPLWGSPQDPSPSVDTFGGSIQMWARCGEWQEKGITTSLGSPGCAGDELPPLGPSQQSCPQPGLSPGRG